MMKTIKLVLIFSIILLLSCDKDKATIKGIEGEWMIQKLHLIDPVGFKTNVQPTGKVTFTNSGSGKYSNVGKYILDLSYVNNGDTTVIQLEGVYEQTESKEFILNRTDGSPFRALTPYFTKHDLQLDLPNLDHMGYYFILKR